MVEIDDFKARDKEIYGSAIERKLINLGLEASKDGVREYYYDAVLDFFTDIPASIKNQKIPAKLNNIKIWPNIILTANKTWMDIFGEIMEKYPETEKDEKDSKKINTTRTYAIKQLTIELYHIMGSLRQVYESAKGDGKDFEEEAKNWE